MENILEQIENVKEKLSSEEYKTLMESLSSVHKKIQDEYEIEIFYSKVDVILSDDNFVMVHPDNGYVKLKQSGIPAKFHNGHTHGHHHENLLDGKFHNRRLTCFIDILSKENRDIFFKLKHSNVHHAMGHSDIDVCFDDDTQWIYFRINKVNVPPPQDTPSPASPQVPEVAPDESDESDDDEESH